MCPKHTCVKSEFSDWVKPTKEEIHSEEEDFSDLMDPQGLIYSEYLAALDREFFTQFGAADERAGSERGDRLLTFYSPSFSLLSLSSLLLTSCLFSLAFLFLPCSLLSSPLSSPSLL